jgi:hypothetical protein
MMTTKAADVEVEYEGMTFVLHDCEFTWGRPADQVNPAEYSWIEYTKISCLQPEKLTTDEIEGLDEEWAGVKIGRNTGLDKVLDKTVVERLEELAIAGFETD